MRIQTSIRWLGLLALMMTAGLAGCGHEALLVNDLRNEKSVDPAHNAVVCFTTRAPQDLSVTLNTRHIEDGEKYSLPLMPSIDGVAQTRVLGVVVHEKKFVHAKLQTDLVVYQLPPGHYALAGFVSEQGGPQVLTGAPPLSFEARPGQITYLGDLAFEPKSFLWRLSGVKVSTKNDVAGAKAQLAELPEYGLDRLPLTDATLPLRVD